MGGITFMRKHAIWAACFPLVGFFIVFFLYAVNIPFADDWGVLYILCLWEKLTLLEKCSALFAQHNEHRIALTRAFGIIHYYLSGNVDVRYWMFLGNIGYVIILAVFYRHLRRENQMELLPTVSFCLFTPLAFGNIFSGMQNGNTLFVAFTILLFYCIAYGKHIGLSIGVLAILMFTNGGGFLPFFICLALLFYNKRHKEAFIFGLAGFLLLALYFWGYRKVLYHPDPIDSLVQYPEIVFAFFFAFLGSMMAAQLACLLSGLAMFITGFLFLRHFKHQQFVISLIAWILLTALSVSLNRAGFGLEMATTNRYRLYSQVLFIAIAILIFQTTRPSYKVIVFWLMFAFSSTLFLYKTIIKRSIYAGRRQAALDQFFNWRATGHFLADKETTFLANKLITNGFYTIPTQESKWITEAERERFIQENKQKVPLSQVSIAVDSMTRMQDKLYLSLQLTPHKLLTASQTMLLLVPFGHEITPSYYMPGTNNEYLVDLNVLNPNLNVNPCKIEAIIPLSRIPKGHYDIYCKIKNPLLLDNDYLKLTANGITL